MVAKLDAIVSDRSQHNQSYKMVMIKVGKKRQCSKKI